MHLKNKGFLLIDSLITVFITTSLCMLCFSIYKSSGHYADGYYEYQKNSNKNLENIFDDLPECEVCNIDEPD